MPLIGDLLQLLRQIWDGIMLFIHANPWLTPVASILVALLAIGRRVIRRFTQRILTKLEEKLNLKADSLGDWLIEQPETLLAARRFQRRYYQSLIYGLRDFRVQGLKTRGPFVLDLQKVFVPLRITPESLENIPSQMLPVEPSGAGLNIWDCLAAIATHPTFRRIVVLGPPGSGKSTLLEHLTLTYAQRRHRHQHPKAPDLIPMLLYVRDVRGAIATDTPPPLPALLEQQDPIHQLTPPPQWFETRLNRGKCLVMFDGLDEVADPAQRQQVSRWVDQQMKTYPANTFILTSRPFGYKTAPLDRVSTLEVKPFNLAQVYQFISNWYLQNEIMSRLGTDDSGVRAGATRQAQDLINRIQGNSALAAMALNPLLLTMIVTVHRYRGALPGRRVELYAEICDVLLERRLTAKGISDKLTAAQKKAVLQVLALKGMQRSTREFKLVTACLLIRQRLQTVVGIEADPEEFLRDIENVSGLLVQREEGMVEFAHKSFQEYLAAVQIKELNREAILSQQLENSWWEETIRLYAAQSDASYLIQTALDRNTVQSLTLAYECQEEALSIQPSTRRQLEKTLEEGLESTDPDLFRLAAEVKLSRRLKNLLRLDEITEIDTSSITCAEYQLFVDEKQQAGENRQSQSWREHRFPPGIANQPVMGVNASHARDFCDWLTQKSGNPGDTFLVSGSPVFVGDLRYRLATALEIREPIGERIWIVRERVHR